MKLWFDWIYFRRSSCKYFKIINNRDALVINLMLCVRNSLISWDFPLNTWGRICLNAHFEQQLTFFYSPPRPRGVCFIICIVQYNSTICRPSDHSVGGTRGWPEPGRVFGFFYLRIKLTFALENSFFVMIFKFKVLKCELFVVLYSAELNFLII